MEFDEYPITQLPQTKIVVFMISTTGNGEAPQTMQKAWKFLLRSDLPANSLSKVNFTVFGLGDSSYALFNAMAKKLTQRMINLGSNLFHKVGLGDYQHDFGFEGEFDPWLQNLWSGIQSLLPHVIKTDSVADSDLLPPVYLDQKSTTNAESSLNSLPTPHGAVSPLILAKLVENQKLTSESHFQDTRKISLQMQVDYEAGDVIMVHPANNQNLVTDLLAYMNLNPSDSVCLKADKSQVGQLSSKSLIPFPEHPITYSELFTHWLNISEPPSRFCCEVLSNFTDSPMHKEKLKHFASSTADGKSEYFSYCQREKRNIFEVMKDFQIYSNVPLGYFIQCVGRQRVREYSISSFKPGSVDLTMAVTEFKTKFGREITGVCSGFLRDLPLQSEVPVWLKKGTMKFDGKKPMIFVGPGTGVAAFRSAIQKFQNTETPLVLVFGCRSQQDDFYYAEEWKLIKNLTVITAFSRASPEDGKVYVQHKIRANAGLLSDLVLNKDALIFVSGRAKFMPNSVEKALVEITSKDCIDLMKKQGRYQQEVW